MKFTMLENGLDFILDSIIHLQKAEKDDISNDLQARELKYALLNLSSGIELIFKSRLNNEHWTYIFADMNTANRNKYLAGSLKTVDSSTSIERLENLCDYKFSDKHKIFLQKLREARNRFEHGEIDNNQKAIESIINNAIVVIAKFIQDNYAEFEIPNSMEHIGFTKKEKELYKKLVNEIAKLNKHHDDAVNLARARALDITLEEDLIICPECSEKLLRHADEEEKCECFFCGYSDLPEETARRYVESVLNISEYEEVKNGGEFPRYKCPNCESESMVYIESENIYICFNCGMRYGKDELSLCDYCGKLYWLEDGEIPFCEECVDYLKNKE